MPKIIENLESKLIAEAKKQIEENGYAALTIRSVAKACGVGVGTVYNYFPSKDILMASYMHNDWLSCRAAINTASAHSNDPAVMLRCMFDEIKTFCRRHEAIFLDEDAKISFTGYLTRYRKKIRSILAEPLKKFCAGDFSAEFITEAVLTWALEGKEFDDIFCEIKKLF